MDKSKDLKVLKDLEDKIKILEQGKLGGEEAAVLIDECVRLTATQGS